jgi:hypothetical protein
MIELNKERIDQIVYDETPKTDVLPTILRSIYNRYMHLYENYFTDIDALDDKKIAELKKYYEETRELIKYFYLDIPIDTYLDLDKFDKEYTYKLLGAGWHDYLFENYGDFRDLYVNKDKTEKEIKSYFADKALEYFYDDMDAIFRDDFGTASKTAEMTFEGLKSLFTKE